MNGKVNTAGEKTTHSSTIMVPDLSSKAQSYTRTSQTARKVAKFGKGFTTLRRNPKTEVTKQGWLYKQASSGGKQWNKRWFVLTDRCLFYYKDEKEDTVLGSLPLHIFRIGGVEPSDHITRKFAIKVWLDKGEEGQDEQLTGPVVFCIQAAHPGTRTYYFSAESHEEQEDWIRAMSEASEFNVQQPQRNTSVDVNQKMVTKVSNPQQHSQTHNKTHDELFTEPKMNEVNSFQTHTLSTPCSEQKANKNNGNQVKSEGEGYGPEHTYELNHHPNSWGNYSPPNTMSQNSNGPLPKHPASRSNSVYGPTQGHLEGKVGPLNELSDQEKNILLRRSFLPRTAPERVSQRKSSMAQLQQWVNQRRGMASQEDINSPSCYYPVSQDIPAEYCSYSGVPHYVEEYPLYPTRIRPDSISPVLAVGGYSQRWTDPSVKRHSLRDGLQELYEPSMPRNSWVSQYYGEMERPMRHLFIQPRSRSVPRSPSASSRVPPNFVSPAGSPSAHFDQYSRRMKDDVIYADPSFYGLRRSFSSPKYDYSGNRRSLSQGLYHLNHNVSPFIQSKMAQGDILDLQLRRNLNYLDQQVPPLRDVYGRDLHPTLKLNEMETSKLLGRLCEQNQILKGHEAVVHRLKMDKDDLEEALVATHQEIEFYHNQPLAIEKLQFRKETLQNQLIAIRGELSQASSALTTTRMEFEVLEDEANAIHGDLWEQLNAGEQSEMVHRHIQKEFWRVQDVLEGLHKINSSRGSDTAKHRGRTRVLSVASGSFSTNSPASPLSSISLTSPFSPVPGIQASPTKDQGVEENVPPRPPLPRSYSPVEQSPTCPPPIPSFAIDNTQLWLCSSVTNDGFSGGEDTLMKSKFEEQKIISDVQDQFQDRQSINKVGIVPPRTKSPIDKSHSNPAVLFRHNGRGISRERPKSAVFPAEVKSKMSIEEQNERIRRNQSSSMRDKRRSVNLSAIQSPANYKVVRRRLTTHEIDIKNLETAVQGQGQESPQEEIARLRRLQIEAENFNLEINKELVTPDKVLIPERYLYVEDDIPVSPEEQREKQKKLERIRTLIAKSNLQNLVPLLDGPAESGVPVSSQQQLQEQEKRIEISCTLATEASRRSRILSAPCAPSTPSSWATQSPLPSSADFPKSTHTMKV